MQLTTVVGAVALLSTTAFANPRSLEKKDAERKWGKNLRHQVRQVEGITMTDETTSTAPFPSSNTTCPTNVVTNYITVTANVTNSVFLFPNPTTTSSASTTNASA
ncbi:hypothetical protein G7Y89_g8937 [Cudoniella acicularis]|uniref:Uncharacterized protein n=1 Tax=Cudoniella acicularis TaxID=354080 RepID=A0A8H4W2E1_9HELO|nr:hypothetical protein G7Y89_g8937 [Cudoniella acicularis]